MLTACGSRTSQHSQSMSPIPAPGCLQNSHTPPTLFFHFWLGGWDGVLASLPIPSAKTLPGPHSGAQKQSAQAGTVYLDPQPTCSLGSQTSQPSSGQALPPLCNSQGLPGGGLVSCGLPQRSACPAPSDSFVVVSNTRAQLAHRLSFHLCILGGGPKGED